jgi:hypothetical protein
MLLRPARSGKLTASHLGLLIAALLGVGLGAAAISTYRVAWPGEGRAACRGGSASMARLELVFGTGRKEGGAVGEAEWQSFVDAEITPRFPDGLTVLTGYGQWRSGAKLLKEGARLLLIWYPPAPDSDGKIEAIRTSYKQRFGQDSVLRADGLSCVGF